VWQVVSALAFAIGAVVPAMKKGQQAWVRVRGAPNDPDSFDLATWKGAYWEIPKVNSLGETIYLQIADYLISETLSPMTDPEQLFKPAEAKDR
jgi:hypothetical protein